MKSSLYYAVLLCLIPWYLLTPVIYGWRCVNCCDKITIISTWWGDSKTDDWWGDSKTETLVVLVVNHTSNRDGIITYLLPVENLHQRAISLLLASNPNIIGIHMINMAYLLHVLLLGCWIIMVLLLYLTADEFSISVCTGNFWISRPTDYSSSTLVYIG